MRWFKHMTASADDEKLARLIDECGLAGYGFWWRILEIVSNLSDGRNKTEVAYSEKTWCRNTRLSHRKFNRLLACFEKCGLGIVHRNGSIISITLPILNQIREVEVNSRPDLLTSDWKLLREKIFQRDDFTCRYCGSRSSKLECDHVVPVALGGKNTEDNLVTSCMKCNRSKGVKTLEEWLQ